MKKIIYPSTENINSNPKVAVLGKFETLHKGHKFLIWQGRQRADQESKELLVMFFSEREKDNFYSLEERLMFADQYKIDYALIFEPVKDNFAHKHTEFERYLKDLGVTDVIVGDDFRYGNNREGNIDTLSKEFNVQVINEQASEKVAYRTSNLIKAIKEDDLETYKEIMDHYFFYKGKVVKGLGNGKKFGMPTANVEYPDYKIDINDGIYYSYVIYDGQRLPSLTSISYNPTLDAKEKTYETYIYNFDKDIYGEELYVELIEKYREPIKFNSIEELVAKLDEDKKLGVRKRR